MTAPAKPSAAPRAGTVVVEVARRVLRKYFRTPGLFAMGLAQSAMFLFSFRYIFGGAIHVGAVTYVDYLVPGYVATIVLFTGGGIAVAVAEDRAQGFTGRLLSLPIGRTSIVAGRVAADFITNAWSILFTAAVGFAFGFRLTGSVSDGLAALGLCLVYGLAFTVVFVVIGLAAPNPQGAQGLSMIAFVLAFISSTYVPARTMPVWLQPFAKYQPITPMVDAVRSALAGHTDDIGVALVWSVAVVLVFAPLAVILYRRN